jgi:hypothetical protein
LAACLALLLALVLLGFYYGCAKSSRPERPTAPPPPSGMSAQLDYFAPQTQSQSCT